MIVCSDALSSIVTCQWIRADGCRVHRAAMASSDHNLIGKLLDEPFRAESDE
jgi:hypothetical protein